MDLVEIFLLMDKKGEDIWVLQENGSNLDVSVSVSEEVGTADWESQFQYGKVSDMINV